MTTRKSSFGDRWEAQAYKCLGFIEDLAATPTMHGVKWQRSMIEHYGRQLSTILSQTPRGRGKVKKDIQSRHRKALKQFESKYGE